jgi:hypothetical protein
MKALHDNLDFLDAPFAKAQPISMDRRLATPQATVAVGEEHVSLWKRCWGVLVLVVRASGVFADPGRKTARN